MRQLRSVSRVAAVLAGAMVVGAGVAGVAYGSHINTMVGNANYNPSCSEGGPGWGRVCRTDNASVYYYMDSNGAYELESPDRTDVKSTISNDYRPTDLTVTYDSTPKFSGSGETDVIYQEGAVENGFDGYTWCNDASPAAKYECDQTYIRIRGNGTYTRGLACHETGHAVGLLHGANSNPKVSNTHSDLGCMRTPVSSGASLGSNQRYWINRIY